MVLWNVDYFVTCVPHFLLPNPLWCQDAKKKNNKQQNPKKQNQDNPEGVLSLASA